LSLKLLEMDEYISADALHEGMQLEEIQNMSKLEHANHLNVNPLVIRILEHDQTFDLKWKRELLTAHELAKIVNVEPKQATP
jgi:hypothetical protein